MIEELTKHLYREAGTEIYVDFEAICLLLLLIQYKDEEGLTVNKLSDMMKVDKKSVESDLELISRAGLITYSYDSSPEQLLKGTIKVTLNESLLQKIATNKGWNKGKQKQKKKTGWVYLLHSEKLSLYKIGVSNNVQKRVKELSTGVGELTVVSTCKVVDTYRLEKALHERFRYCRKHGEWFDLSGTDIAYFNSLSEKLSL